MNILDIQRQMMMEPPHQETASGAMVSFPKGVGAALTACAVNIELTQEGSGDPTPSNVRNIAGWTGARIFRSGADTDNPTVYNIAFPTEAGDICCGTLDVLAGTLTTDMALLTFDGSEDEHWHDDGSYVSVAYKYLSPAPVKSQYLEAGTMFSNMGKPGSQQTGVTPGTVTISWTGSLAVHLYAAMGVSDFAGFLAYLAQHPLQVAYQRATPITVQLTPQQIRSITGQNNIWSDAGEISATYWTH